MSDENSLINLTKCLLESIVGGNWDAYSDLCAPDLTCFEPEALGHLVEGLNFHKFYFDLERSGSCPVQTTLADPHVRIIGDAAIVCYVRLTQSLDSAGHPVTRAVEETRVWQRIEGQWKHVHFHRSPVAK